MPTDADPIEFNWYAHLDKGQSFRVVAVDEDSRSVDIQYFDGQVEEIDMDAWYEMDVEPAEAPENWSGAVDVGEVDDFGTEITDTQTDDWNSPMQEVKAQTGEEPEDEWGEGSPDEEPLENDL